MNTNIYDLRFCYDPSFDNFPIIEAYEMFINKDNFLETDQTPSFRYVFTANDYEWLTSNQEALEFEYFDEWFTSDYIMAKLPIAALEFINSLPHYERENLMEEN